MSSDTLEYAGLWSCEDGGQLDHRPGVTTRQDHGASSGSRASKNLAASAGAWSARHRRKAIFGWLAFVLAAYIVGGLAGERNLTDAQMGNGQSATALSLFEKAFPYHNGEEVLIQARGSAAPDRAAVRSAAADLVARLRRLPTVADIESPFPATGAVTSPGLRSNDREAVLVTFELAGNSNQAENYVKGPFRPRPRPLLTTRSSWSRSAARLARPRRWARPSTATSPKPSTLRYRSRSRSSSSPSAPLWQPGYRCFSGSRRLSRR